MKILLILPLFSLLFICNSADAAKNISQETYQKAWTSYYENDIKTVQGILNSFDFTAYNNGEMLGVLKAQLLLDEGKYKKALDVITIMRNKIIDKMGAISPTNQKTSYVSDAEFIYYKMLGIRGSANYSIGNYHEAIPDLTDYTKENKSAVFFDMISLCYYHEKEIPKAIHFMQKAYYLYNICDQKYIAAYNISAMYSLQKNIDNVLIWLNIALDYDFDKYFLKLQSDPDFNSVRNIERFIKFVDNYGSSAE